ncbi:hypothetical protein BKA70DRAFT_1422359 [Coprinopsis sp. MPI-PUGE-AT-0042]|nr:hypothetical protein BKA70DRAFT_1422359 [Coprinopsis sp. MPI-PUGE-AT-0042]
MMLSASRQFLLRICRTTRPWGRPSSRYNHANAEVRRPPGSEPKPEPEDFRPPWVYASSRFGSVVVIPATMLYGIFLYDWGDREHVFMPARRWLARLKQQYMTLTPEEERMLNKPIVEDRVLRLPPVPPLPPPPSS